jgi:hypothetical protein
MLNTPNHTTDLRWTARALGTMACALSAKVMQPEHSRTFDRGGLA